MEIKHIFLDQPHSNKWNIPSSRTKHQIFFLVIKGQVTYFIGGKSIPLQAGDGMFISPGTVRSAETDPSSFHTMYSIHFNDSTIEKKSPLNKEAYEMIRPLSYDYLRQRLSVLYESWIGKMPFYKMVSQGILLEILGIAQREIYHSNKYPSIKRNLALRIQQYIVQHFREPLRLQELSKHVDRTPNYISNMFKEVTGWTPVEYMHQVRISTARELLHNSKMNIGEISDYLGYCDQTYFNYIYKKIVGHPPSNALKKRN
jgi:AraC-like DNA-binding protein